MSINAGSGFLFPNSNAEWFREQKALDPASGGQTKLADGSTQPRGNPYSFAHPLLDITFHQKISLESWFLNIGATFMLTPSMVRDLQAQGVNPTSIDNKAAGGAVFWIEAHVGARAYFLTDNVRPFFEFGMRLTVPIYTTSVADIMPGSFKVIPGAFAALGLELIVARDIGVIIMPRYTLFFPINYSLMHMVDAILGVIFYI